MPDSKRALYFFAYGPLVKCDQAGTPATCEGGNVPIKVEGQFQDDGAIGFSLKATFDIRNPETEAAGKDFYYVPRSCEDCHGKSIATARSTILTPTIGSTASSRASGLPTASSARRISPPCASWRH